MKAIDVANELEKMIAVYFNGNNYEIDGVELSRADSRIIAYFLIHTYQQTELMVFRRNVK